ncbi:MAG: hypothetical protein JOZ81_21275 [Chloroflexi bacterium]|nr:hypothetical protein [Chloroflexota bacterium]
MATAPWPFVDRFATAGLATAVADATVSWSLPVEKFHQNRREEFWHPNSSKT